MLFTHYLMAYTCKPLRTHCDLCKVLQDKWWHRFIHIMPDSGLATPWTIHECVWSYITIYLARPCTGYNVYSGVCMCTPRGNVHATVFNLLDWIYLARPCTGYNVYAGAYMCTPWGNDDAPVFNFLDWTCLTGLMIDLLHGW